VHHGAALRGLTRDDDLVDAVSRDPRIAPLAPRERALVDHALLLAREPEAVRREHVDALRAHGLDDRALLDLTLVVGYFSFVNRIASGLGVEVEPDGPPHPSHD
jgi:uncharacterized peroxidase-related enzyme